MRMVTAILLILVIGNIGCESRDAQQGKMPSQQPQAAEKQTDSFSHVITTEAEYYTTGPQQGRPPDGKFPAGTKVTIVREEGSYTLVRSEAGVEAYVSSDAVKETEP
jgi:uncharacterized protein YgiM (DUF1202 family)